MKLFDHPVNIPNLKSTALVVVLLFACFSAQTVLAGLLSSDDFVTTWKTDNPGTSNATSITVPMVGGPYDVDWDNDGIFDQFGFNGSVTHDFGVAGTYTIRINGAFTSINFGPGIDNLKIIAVNQWGIASWQTMQGAFFSAQNLQVTATDAPDLSAVSSLSFMFYDATLANPDVTAWDTSMVSNMNSMFANATSFDRDLGAWKVEALTQAANMFANVKLSTANYDNLLISWDMQTLKKNVVFDGGYSRYCAEEAVNARANMIAADNWNITDAGPCPPELVFEDGFEDPD